MNTSTQTKTSTKFKVGIFAVLGLLMIGLVTVLVNDRPYWWRGCQPVHISVEDATGLKMKSPVRSLGLEIGYLRSVDLTETHVRLGICITAPVEVLPATRAYIRGEGFLGDKFVELKPVRYIGNSPAGAPTEKAINTSQIGHQIWLRALAQVSNGLMPQAYAQATGGTPPPARQGRGGREIPVGQNSQDVQHLVNQVDGLVDEMTSLTNNLKEAINPQELRATMNRLNKTLENASRTLSPEGGLNTTAQRTLAKLEDSIEQLRDLMTRVNKGEGSLGMLLNDPEYAEEIRAALKSMNVFLGRANRLQFWVDIGADYITAYNEQGRGYLNLQLWPVKDRYYMLGLSQDPRGRRNITTVITRTGGRETQTQTETIDQGSLLITAMFGKVFYERLDLSIGVLFGDGAASAGLLLGPKGFERMAVFRNDFYTRGQGLGADDRGQLILRPFIKSPTFGGFYAKAGWDSIHRFNGHYPWMFGAGITFSDDDIKLLFALQ